MKTLLVMLVALALAGCGATQTATETATPAATDPAVATDAAAASAPNLIAELTDQKMVYECPKCGMMFDAAGTCSMGCAELVATQVAYICPKDQQAVATAGQCPRCPMPARVDKTAMAVPPAPDQH